MEKGEIRFLTDGTVGKLTRYMRMAGFDTVYLKDGKDLVTEGRKSGRIIVTRNLKIAKRCETLKIECIPVKDNYPDNQLKEVLMQIFNLKKSVIISPFTRCIPCNSLLEDVLQKKDVQGWVPPYVFKTQEKFKRCPSCGRIYWNATHKKSMLKILNTILQYKTNSIF